MLVDSMNNCFNRLFAVWTVHAFIVDTEGRLTYILQSLTKYDDEGGYVSIRQREHSCDLRRHWRVAVWTRTPLKVRFS